MLAYLARYTHRVAISNPRLVRLEGGQVTFTYKDYSQGGRVREMTLPVEEFIRRFLLHVLPESFVRIRYFGLLSNRHRKHNLARCRELLVGQSVTEVEILLARGLAGSVDAAHRSRPDDLCSLRTGPPPVGRGAVSRALRTGGEVAAVRPPILSSPSTRHLALKRGYGGSVSLREFAVHWRNEVAAGRPLCRPQGDALNHGNGVAAHCRQTG